MSNPFSNIGKKMGESMFSPEISLVCSAVRLPKMKNLSDLSNIFGKMTCFQKSPPM